MKKIIAITSCMLAFSSFSHAGWLDAIKTVKTVTDTAEKTSAVTNVIPGVDEKTLVTTAIKTQMGDNATKESIKATYGEPSIPGFKNAAGDEIWQYGMAGMLKSLGTAAAMLNSQVKDLTQSVEFTFKGDAVINVAVVDATNASVAVTPLVTDAVTPAPTTEVPAETKTN